MENFQSTHISETVHPRAKPLGCSVTTNVLDDKIHPTRFNQVVFITGSSLHFWLDFFWRYNNQDLIYIYMYVNGVAVAYAHRLEVFARCIPTVWGYYSRLQTKSSVAAANRKWFFRSGYPCVQRDFLAVAYCLRLAQSILTVGHTGDCTVKPLMICWQLNAVRPTSSSQNSSKISDRRIGYRSKTPPLAMSHEVGKRSKTTGVTSPNLIVWRQIMLSHQIYSLTC